MFKISKKLILMYIFSLCWSQIEFTADSGHNDTLFANPEDQPLSQGEVDEKSKLENARKLLNLENKHFETDDQKHLEIENAAKKAASDDAQNKNSNEIAQKNLKEIENARELLHQNLINERIAKSPEYILYLKTDQIKALTSEEIKKLTYDQIKVLLEHPYYLSKLTAKQIQELNPETLAAIITGKATIFSKKWQGNNYLSAYFINNLTPAQAKAIVDSKSFLSDHNYYLSKDQQKLLENKAKAILSIEDIREKNFEERELQALSPDFIARAITGKATIFGKRWQGNKYLSNDFINSLTPAQAKAIVDSKSFLSDHNYYLSKDQQKRLEDIAKRINNQIASAPSANSNKNNNNVFRRNGNDDDN